MLKNITLSAEEQLIARARERARAERSTLNAAFREWLERYAKARPHPEDFRRLMSRLSYASPGRTFNRDELNER